MTTQNSKSMSLNDAMSLAISSWQKKDPVHAAEICRAILTQRPGHQGAKHLLITIEHGVSNLIFTAIFLHDPSIFDVGDFSYGVPIVARHNQPDEPARLTIGSYCTIANDVHVYLGAYHRHDTFTIYPFSAPHLGSLFPSTRSIKKYSSTRGGVRIGNDVWIGAHSVILSGVTIGDGAVIGAGSVVSRNVGPYEVWAGNPAEFRKYRFADEISNRLLRLRWWDWSKTLVEANAHEIMSGSEESLKKLESVKIGFMQNKHAEGQWVAGNSVAVRFRKSKAWQPGRPTWIVLHGALGCIETVAGIEAYLPGVNLVFVDLPGCGQTMPPAEMTVAGFAAELLPALRALVCGDYYILGVSFGGCVGLEIARQSIECKRVVLLDTPFSSEKLWQNHFFLRGAIARQPDNQYVRRFALEIYGVTEQAAVERDYWNLLDGLQVPVTVVTGDVPLLPERNVPTPPCCLDEGDLMRLNKWGARIVRIAGGHDLINENPDAVAQVVIAAIDHGV
jgi:acetyltransferase-like isoleucine patch superfamily enzyme/pimeloyl-ACP methyl ester carboxylesterase